MILHVNILCGIITFAVLKRRPRHFIPNQSPSILTSHERHVRNLSAPLDFVLALTPMTLFHTNNVQIVRKQQYIVWNLNKIRIYNSPEYQAKSWMEDIAQI
jgi:hypothetical protein